MITFIPFAAGNVVGLRVDARIDAADMDRIAAVCKDKLARHRKLGVDVEVPSFNGIYVEAFFKDLKIGLSEWSRYDKEAVVTDQSWLAKVTSATGRLVPGLEVKAFPVEQAAAAEAWIAD
jgi:hypothetical protein